MRRSDGVKLLQNFQVSISIDFICNTYMSFFLLNYKLFNSIGRSGTGCNHRWINHLNPNICKDPWTEEEDRIILQLVSDMGTKLSKIAKLLPRRTYYAIRKRNEYLERRIKAEELASLSKGLFETYSSNDILKMIFSDIPAHVKCTDDAKKERLPLFHGTITAPNEMKGDNHELQPAMSSNPKSHYVWANSEGAQGAIGFLQKHRNVDVNETTFYLHCIFPSNPSYWHFNQHRVGPGGMMVTSQKYYAKSRHAVKADIIVMVKPGNEATIIVDNRSP